MALLHSPFWKSHTNHPLRTSNNSKMSDSYELITSCKANDVIPVYGYKSKTTGMTVVIAQVEGPLVNGYFCLATEAHDDDGLPHTLEHLVFMGSELYPYKGVLDLVANRSLASGTNAWTDTDHTCYTMTNAGSEGFLNLLPIYLDHVLYPTLTEAGYMTEVHHVNEEGENAGVVYCEMQARENTGESRTHLAFLRAMYPGHCGYKSETGGMLQELRTSTSHKKVCDYHREFYRPENLCLIITGQVEPDAVFAALKPVEARILAKGERSPYTRPWQSQVPPLMESVNKVIKYGADEEDHGMAVIGWRGPSGSDQRGLMALMVLLDYLTDTSVSPLQRDFVELADSYCSRVRFSVIENKESCVYFNFANVHFAKLGLIHDRLMALLAKLGSGEEAFDMKRLGNVIHRKILETMSSMEDSPHDSLAFIVIGDFLNSTKPEEIIERVNGIALLKDIADKSEQFWVDLLNQYLVNKPSITIVGEPSNSLMTETGDEEKARVAKQRETLGEAGLKKHGEDLQKASEANEVEPPESMLTQVPVPDVGCIKFHPISPCSNFNDKKSNPKFPLNDMPVAFQFADIQTNFATILVTMDTASIPKDLRFYLPLLLEVLSESPVKRGDVVVSHEDIIRELAADTLSQSASIGIGGRKFSCGSVSQVVSLSIKVEKDKYKKGIDWVRELLYQTQLNGERLRIVANKMINDVSELRRNGRFVVQSVIRGMLFTKESNHTIASVLRQHKFLTSLVAKLDDTTSSDKVLADMTSLRDTLTRPDNMRIHLAASSSGLDDPTSPWQQNLLPAHLKSTQFSGKLPNIKLDNEYLNAPGKGPGQGFIVGVGSVESAYLTQTVPGIINLMDPDLPALMVFIQYLTQLEGPMWRQIRGLGLSYHYSMYVDTDTGVTRFILFKSTHVANAYKVGQEIVDGFLTGKTPFSEVEFESAKSSLIFEVIEEEKTPANAAHEAMLASYRGIAHDFNRYLIKQIPKVSLDDLRRVGPKYVTPLFDVSKSRCAVVCHPSKVEEIVTSFKELSRDLSVLDSMDESFLTTMDL